MKATRTRGFKLFMICLFSIIIPILIMILIILIIIEIIMIILMISITSACHYSKFYVGPAPSYELRVDGFFSHAHKSE